LIDGATLIGFVLVAAAIVVVPGPAVLLTLARSLSGGRSAGIATALGIAVGDVIHTLAAAIGLSALLMASALAFEVVKYAGAAYLIYLGIKAFRDGPRRGRAAPAHEMRPAAAFRQAILAEVLNPKTALFFLSFLPQFVRPEAGSAWLQLIVLGLVFLLLGVAVTLFVAVFAGRAGRWLLQSERARRWQGRIAGGIYLALGVRLALQQRQ
jgi:threonine/homoserine/homoserine lactone efflux protein